MKTLVTLFDGAVLLQEQAGDFFLTFDGSLGGGEVAGWLSGKGSIKLGAGSVALKAGWALLNTHVVPATLLPYAQMVEGLIDAQVAKL